MSRSTPLVLATALFLMIPLAAATEAQTTVFPGAAGFGVDSPAGRGGEIIRVVNLNSEGPLPKLFLRN